MNLLKGNTFGIFENMICVHYLSVSKCSSKKQLGIFIIDNTSLLQSNLMTPDLCFTFIIGDADNT